MSPSTLQVNAVLQRARDVRFRRIEKETVVIRQEAAEALVLNEVGGRLLELLDGEATVEHLLERLLEEYEVSPEDLAQDVEVYLKELLEAGIVIEVTGTTSAGESET
jgi:hypothetical protein